MKIRASQVNTQTHNEGAYHSDTLHLSLDTFCVVRSRFALNPVNHGQEKQAQGEKKRRGCAWPCDGFEDGSFAGPPRHGASSRASV